MENNPNALSVIQLVALVEAGKFPIGCVGSDDLAQRLYDAWSVLIARSCVHARQAAIARRDINQAMSEMGNNQGGYHLMERCLEQMQAQEGVDAPAIVLTMQFGVELRDLYQVFDHEVILAHLDEFIRSMEGAYHSMADRGGSAFNGDVRLQLEVLRNQITQQRNAVSLLRALLGFLPTEACKGAAS